MKPLNLNDALDIIEQHELVGAKIKILPERYNEMLRDIGAPYEGDGSDNMYEYIRTYITVYK